MGARVLILWNTGLQPLLQHQAPETHGTNGTIVNVAAGNTSVYITGLSQGTQYTYYVREDCSASSNGYSVNSASQTFTSLLQLSLGSIVANQQTVSTTVGASNAAIWRLDLPVAGTSGTLTLNSIKFTSENTNDADVAASGVKLWTGTTTGPSTQIGTTQSFVSGAVAFSGLNLNLAAGTTYIWLTYNVSATATIGDVLDAKINAGDISITANGLSIAPGTQPSALLDPAGNVLIDYCDNYLYTTGCNDNDALIDFTISNLNQIGLGCIGNVSNVYNSGYGNFTTTPRDTINLIQGATYNWTAAINYPGNHWLQMWIDLNNNGVFETGETLLTVPFPQPANTAYPATFGSSLTLSASASPGYHRFRVREVYSSATFDACTQYQYGEVQDYVCNITTPDCPVPSSATASNMTFTSAQANWTCNGCTGSFIVEYGPAGVTPGAGTTPGTNGTIITVASGNTSVAITGLNNATQYTYYIREDCTGSSNGYSINSGAQNLTTLGTIVANQQTGTDQPGTTGINILRLDIPVAGNIATLVLNSINFTSENTNDADVASGGVKLYTGTTSGPVTQIGTSQTFSSGAATFSGLNLSLITGTTYYLWLTYDITTSATLNDLLDAKINANDIAFTSGGAGAAIPTSLLDPAGNVVVNYCTSLYTTGCAAADYLTSFSLSNLSLTGLSCYGTSNTPTAGYVDFSSSEPVINLAQGGTYTWNATYAYPSGEYVKIWIDLNDNGNFNDAGELIYDGTLTGTNLFSGTFTLSSIAAPGNHRMRVRDVYANTGFGPCGIYGNGEGEVQDYTVNIQAVTMVYASSTTTQNSVDVTSNTTNQLMVGLQIATTGSLTPLNLSSISFNTTGTTSSSADISNARIYYTGTSSSFATTGQYGSTVASPNGAVTVSGSLSLAQGTNYFWLTYDIPAGAPTGDYAGSAITSFVLGGVSETPTSTASTIRQIELYCDPTPYTDCNSSPDGGISRVLLNNIDNSSGCSATGDYTNYSITPSSSQTTSLIAGQTYTIIIDRGVNTTVAYTVKVWIDFNQDGTFSNSSPELIYSFTSTNYQGFSGSFTVPLNAANGATRMRVRMAKTVDDACDNTGDASNYGETEDYRVTIQSPCTNVGITSATAAVGSVCPGVTTSITANGVIGTNPVLHWWGGSGGTGTDYGTSNPLTGVGAGTYYAYVTGDCGAPVQASATVSALSVTSSSNSATACNSYVWNSTTYTSSGTYSYDGGSNAAGCDSTVNLNLTINYSNSSTTNHTACNSYLWNGTTYTTSGAYSYDAGSNAAGCDSVANINLTINYSSSSTSNHTACNSYLWNSTTYTASGAYSFDAGSNAAGCDSTANINLTINYSSSSTANNTACNNYQWNSTTYTASGAYSFDAGSNAAGCDSTANINLTINYSSSSTTNHTACNSYQWNSTTYTTSGSYSFDAGSNAAGCDSTANINLTINYSSSSTANHTACDSYLWNSATYTASGAYSFDAGSNAAGCDSTANINLTINYSSSSTTNHTACNSYLWNGTTYTSSGTETFGTTNATGCDSTATLYLTINQCSFNYTVTLFLQGYYMGGGHMSPLLHLLGAASATAVDTVNIELHDSGNTHDSLYAYIGVLNTNGSLVCTFPGAASGNYYIVVKHRNSLETWSASVIAVTSGGSYNFTSGAGQALGSMHNLGGGVYGIYSGDVNKDGTINASDKASIQASLSLFKVGVYNVNDINGDGFVDEDDYRIIENNIPLSISVSRP